MRRRLLTLALFGSCVAAVYVVGKPAPRRQLPSPRSCLRSARSARARRQSADCPGAEPADFRRASRRCGRVCADGRRPDGSTRSFIPERIDDAATDRSSPRYQTLALSTAEIYKQFPPAALLRAARAGTRCSDPADDAADSMQLLQQARRSNQFVAELTSSRVARAAMSERQLQEVMVDFWENHFTVFAGKGQTR